MPETTHPKRTRVCTTGQQGYGCYHITGNVRLGNGDLLTVCVGRRDNCGDRGGVNRVVAPTNQDNGTSRSPPVDVANIVLPDGSEHVAQNPPPSSIARIPTSRRADRLPVPQGGGPRAGRGQWTKGTPALAPAPHGRPLAANRTTSMCERAVTPSVNRSKP